MANIRKIKTDSGVISRGMGLEQILKLNRPRQYDRDNGRIRRRWPRLDEPIQGLL